MNPLIKICGLSTPETVLAALDNGAHLVGFIFFPKSPRHVSIAQAAALRELARGRAMSVAVTVDAEDGMLDEIVSGMRPDIIQLHGHETPQRVRDVKARYGLPVIKAFSVSEAQDLVDLQPYIGVANKLLLDAKAPTGSPLPGGNGVAFDWTLLSALDPDLDYMLSGGLNAGNIAEALQVTNAPGIDISSGVEHAPGIKNIGMMNEFFAAVNLAGQGVEK